MAIRNAGLLASVKEESHGRDIVLLTMPIVGMIGLFVTPPPVRQTLLFSHSRPTVIASFVTHYVHVTQEQLLGSLLLYLLVVPTTYVLGVMAGCRRLSLGIFLTVLGVIPIVLSASSLILVRQGTISGFSTVGMAFVGVLPVILTRYLGYQFRGPIDIEQAPGLFFFGLAVVTYRSVPIPRIQLPLLGATVLLGIAYLWRPFRERSRSRRGTAFGVSARGGSVTLVVTSLLVYVIVLVVAFRPMSDAGATVIDLYLHFLGFSFGFIGSYIIFRIDRRVDI